MPLFAHVGGSFVIRLSPTVLLLLLFFSLFFYFTFIQDLYDVFDFLANF
jgi:uncharacterized membrane protein